MKDLIGLIAFSLMIGLVVVGCAPTPPETTTDQQEVTQADTQQQEEPVAEEPTPTPAPAPETTQSTGADPSTWGGWYIGKAEWVGSENEFELTTDTTIVPGASVLKASSTFADDRVRDLYLGHQVTGLQAGKTYKISLDFRFDTPSLTTDFPDEDPYIPYQKVETKNYIQYLVKDGNQQNHEAFADMEDYPDHDRPDTKYVDESLIGDGNFHSLEINHTVGEGQDSLTLMMIIRFRSNEPDKNSLWIANLKCEEV